MVTVAGGSGDAAGPGGVVVPARAGLGASDEAFGDDAVADDVVGDEFEAALVQATTVSMDPVTVMSRTAVRSADLTTRTPSVEVTVHKSTHVNQLAW
ncbi:hypothetical protein [Terrabacter sp. 2RAF25]|uniref:hypothetical protein n=1 Tax=Terrabacter sp. 2RAF25 TaxID=3232998 RepID=UPI003F981556